MKPTIKTFLVKMNSGSHDQYKLNNYKLKLRFKDNYDCIKEIIDIRKLLIFYFRKSLKGKMKVFLEKREAHQAKGEKQVYGNLDLP